MSDSSNKSKVQQFIEYWDRLVLSLMGQTQKVTSDGKHIPAISTLCIREENYRRARVLPLMYFFYPIILYLLLVLPKKEILPPLGGWLILVYPIWMIIGTAYVYFSPFKPFEESRGRKILMGIYILSIITAFSLALL